MITAYKLSMVKDGAGIKLPKTPVKSPDDAVAILQAYLPHADREHFVVLALDTRLRPVGIHTVAIGSLDASIVHPREVFKFAVLANAKSVILGHNHPSGDPEPSKEDIELTKRFCSAGELLGIEVTDHLILGDKPDYVSLKSRELL